MPVVVKYPSVTSPGSQVRQCRSFQFVNAIMQSGKKSVAERIVYGAFEIISTKGGKDPLEVFSAP